MPKLRQTGRDLCAACDSTREALPYHSASGTGAQVLSDEQQLIQSLLGSRGPDRDRSRYHLVF